MTRRIYRKPKVNVSLFPFLAVLVCTMGALIVLLVLVVQQARVQATVIADPGPTAEELEQARQFELAREDSDWRREILEDQRAALTRQQADHRLQLSHLEDHIRRLEAQWGRLKADAKNLVADSAGPEAAAANAELAQLRAAIDEARQALEDAKLEAAQRPRSFAIIPYRGPHGTQRRPIFIECTGRGIILQPEGLVITGADLRGPLGPGNPLDAALRATREYLVGHGAVAGDAAEPYPLLIVRPDGTEAYAAARHAMKSWDDEFGYELIEADAELAYPAADPVLRKLVAKSLADARQRQELLAAAMPSQFGGRGGSGGAGSGFGGGFGGTGGIVATPYRGGFVPAHQASSGGASRRPEWSRQSPGGPGHDENSPGGSAPGEGSAEAGAADDGAPWRRAQNGSPTDADGNPLRGGADAPGGQPGGTSAREAGIGGVAGGQGGQSGGKAGRAGGSGGSGSALDSGQGPRGVDWALPAAARHATGVTRPVRVACWPDRLLILPDQGDQHGARTILIEDAMADEIDAFVEAVWAHTERWGIALASGYWKPIINVEVAPGGEARFAELERLMEGSGLEVKRKSW